MMCVRFYTPLLFIFYYDDNNITIIIIALIWKYRYLIYLLFSNGLIGTISNCIIRLDFNQICTFLVSITIIFGKQKSTKANSQQRTSTLNDLPRINI